MKNRLKNTAALCFLLMGCANNPSNDDRWPYGPLGDLIEGVGLRKPSPNSTGAKDVFLDNQVEKIDVINLLDPENRRALLCNATGEIDRDNTVQQTQLAQAAFYTYGNTGLFEHKLVELSDTEKQTILSIFKNKHDKKVSTVDIERPNLEVLENTLTALEKELADLNKDNTKNKGEIVKKKKDEIVATKEKIKNKKRDLSILNAEIANLNSEIGRVTGDKATAVAYEDAYLTNICSNNDQKLSFSGEVARRAAKDLALIMRRNSIQDAVIRASEHACYVFKDNLNDRITKTDFALGSLATTTAGLGAIFTDPATARGLSGAAAILSGVNSRYKTAYLQNQTVKVITAGIDQRRQEILDEINGKRFGPPHQALNREYEEFLANRPIEKGRLRSQVAESITKDLQGYADDSSALPRWREHTNRVYYATHPYIPLSPYDKYDKQEQLNLVRELREKQQEKDTIDKKIQESQDKLEKEADTLKNLNSQLQANAGEQTESAQKAADAAIEDKSDTMDQARALAEIDKEIQKKNTALGTKTDEIKSRMRLMSNPLDHNEVRAARLDAAEITGEIQALNAQKENIQKELISDGTKTLEENDNTGNDNGNTPTTDNAAPNGTPSPDGTRTDNTTDNTPKEDNSEALKKEIGEVENRIANLNNVIDSDQTSSTNLATEIFDLTQQLSEAGGENDEIVGMVPLSQYSVELAMADAIRFHAACTIPVGLEAASDSIDEVGTPGFETLLKALDSLNRVRDKIEVYNDKFERPAPVSTTPPTEANKTEEPSG